MSTFRCPFRVLSLLEAENKDLLSLCKVGKKNHFTSAIVSSLEGAATVRGAGLEPYLAISEVKSVDSEGVFFTSKLLNEDVREILRKENKLKIDLLLEEMNEIERVFKGKKVLYSVASKEGLDERYYTELQRHLWPNMHLVFAGSVNGRDHPLWGLRGEKAIPQLSLVAHEAPLFLPGDIEKYLLRGDGLVLAGAVISVSRSIPANGFIEGHLKMISEALISGVSPRVIFPLWLKEQREGLSTTHLDWIEKLSTSYPKLLLLERAKKEKESFPGEDLRSIIDGLILEWKEWQKALEKHIQLEGYDGRKSAFWLEVQSYFTLFKQTAREALMAHQISLPPYFLHEG